MPLSPPKSRQHLHTRDIDLRGYCRDDGLIDIEARFVDRKTYTYDNPRTGTTASGYPVHDMSIRLSIDHSFTVREVEAVMDVQPYGACSDILDNFQGLVGLQIGAGWNRRVRQVIGGALGCTHLGELLGPIATVAYQTMYGDYPKALVERHAGVDMSSDADDTMPFMLNGCYPWSDTGEIIKEDYPDYYRESEPEVVKIQGVEERQPAT